MHLFPEFDQSINQSINQCSELHFVAQQACVLYAT